MRGPLQVLPGWENFFSTEVGASAALAGLIFVGLSINITRILSYTRLPGRAIQSLALLSAILVVALLALVPGQPLSAFGTEVAVVGLAAWVILFRFDLVNYVATDTKYRRSYLTIVVLNQCCGILYILGGLTMVAVGNVGVALLVPATVLSFLKALIDAWVLLVEINR